MKVGSTSVRELRRLDSETNPVLMDSQRFHGLTGKVRSVHDSDLCFSSHGANSPAADKQRKVMEQSTT